MHGRGGKRSDSRSRWYYSTGWLGQQVRDAGVKEGRICGDGPVKGESRILGPGNGTGKLG